MEAEEAHTKKKKKKKIKTIFQGQNNTRKLEIFCETKLN